MKLSSIATVKTGLVLNRKMAKNGNQVICQYLQLNLKSVQEEGFIERSLLEKFESTGKLKAEYLTKPGDIVLRLTTPYTAVLIDETVSGIVISSYFVVIRVNDDKVLPEYLYWYLNTDKVKRIIAKNISSSMIGTVKPTQIAELNIDVLELEEQRKIADLNFLSKQEMLLLERLKGQKELYYKEIMNHIYNEKRKKQNGNDNQK